MKAIVTTAPGEMEVRDVAEAQASEGEVLVRVESVGICGSDLALLTGTHPYSTFPTVQGHEFVGRVVDTSRSILHADLLGQRVAVEPLIPCNDCYACRRGRYNCCADLKVIGAHVAGALTELIAIDPGTAYPVGDLAPDLAVLAEPVSIGLQGVLRGEVAEGERIVCLGAGPIGQAVLLSATDRGARVMVTDLLDSRLELASQLGAEIVVNSGTDDVEEAVAAWTLGEGAAVVLDATGIPAVVRTAFDLVAPSGRIVLIGISTKELSVPMDYFTGKELTVLGSRNNAGVFGDAVDLLTRYRDRAGRLVTHRFPFEETAAALAFAREHPDVAEKVIIEMPGILA